MPRIISFIAGFALCATLMISSLALFAQADNILAILQPLVIDIKQAVPITATVGVVVNDQQVMATVPLTVDVSLQVNVSGINSITVASAREPSISIQPVATGEVLVDDFGHSYTVSIDSDDVELVEWSTFIDANNYFSISGVIQQLPDTPEIKHISATLRAYNSENDVLDIVDIPNVGFRLSIDGSTRFDASVFAEPDSIDHYTVEFNIVPVKAD